VAFLTDGSASHPGSPDWPPERIARARRAEADHALRMLGVKRSHIVSLGWRDSLPAEPGTPPFRYACRTLTGLCRRARIGAVATTWRGEGHADHRAAYAVARSLRQSLHGRVKLFEYLVWGWTDRALVDATRDFTLYALNDPRSLQHRRQAIRHHRTQISPVIRDAENAFRLPPAMIALAERDPAILLHQRGRHAA
jgi:LmbE family N-acetylglucosaminyl deacetylase